MSHGLSGEDVLAIHLVQTDRADIARIVEADVAVAACPRSNRRHGHGDPPLDLLLDAGVRMGLGTDSRASVESLDMRAEARRARALASLDADAALRLITVDGARALGDADFYGVLAAGAWADVCVVRPEEAPTGPDDVAERVLGAGAEAVRATLVAGKLVFERDELRSRA
jgi:5-methylthioadenosine/S-adenosylhomocysteine deaminase